jgi:DNA end-binding protein Ku
MLAHTMFYAPEVHADEEYRADTSSLSEKELNLAQALISSLTAQFEPTKYRDTYQTQLEELIARKVAGQPTVAAAAPPKASTVIDITEALQRSLAALKKPPASGSVEERPSSSPRKKRTRSAS